MKGIKRITLIFYAAFLALCFMLFVVPESRDLAGSYYRGDLAGRDIYLDLKPDGTYKAEWPGCGGSCGAARGAWKSVNNALVFYPAEETGRMKGLVRVLHIVRNYWRTVLVPDPNSEYYKRYEPDGRSAFYRRSRPWFVFPYPTGGHVIAKGRQCIN